MGHVLLHRGLRRIHGCDLLIATPGGLHLVELKAHPGRVVNRDDTWRFTEPETGRVRTLRNPLPFTDAKSKDLESRLEWAADRLKIDRRRLPRVEPAVFLSDPGLRSQLDEVQRVRVYGRDDAAVGLPWIWRDLLARPPQREHQRITPAFARGMLPQLMKAIGVTASVFREELRSLVAERGQDRDKVLTRGRPLQRIRISAAGARVVRARCVGAGAGAAGRVERRPQRAVPARAGLLGRYADAGGQELLVGLQAAARRRAAAPHGLWLLCPGDSPAATPHLGGLMVEVTEVSERLVLDGDFLDGLRAGASVAA